MPNKTAFQFYFFGVAVRFDWIKFDVWLKLGVLNYSSWPKLSSGWAQVKYGVWPGPYFSYRFGFLVVNVNQVRTSIISLVWEICV